MKEGTFAGRFTANWHTHTWRCRHAEGDAADYCRAALAAGLDTLGFSDHSPWPDGVWPTVRMDIGLLEDYCRAVRAAAEEFAPAGLRVFLGLENEWRPDFGGFYDDLFGQYGLDYLIAAEHSFPLHPGDPVADWKNSFSRGDWIDEGEWTRAYGRHALALLASGRYRCFAHPDLFGHFCTKWTSDAVAISRDIAQAARDLDIPLEINTSGFNRPDFTDADGSIRKPYPWRPFWEVVADVGAPAIIGTDCHRPGTVVQLLEPAYAIVDDLGLNLVDTILPVDSDATSLLRAAEHFERKVGHRRKRG